MNETTELTSLPQPILLQILNLLAPEEIAKVGSLNKLFWQVSKNDTLWKDKTTLHFPHKAEKEERKQPRTTITWRERFLFRYSFSNKYLEENKFAFSLLREGDTTRYKSLFKELGGIEFVNNYRSLIARIIKNRNFKDLLDFFYEKSDSLIKKSPIFSEKDQSKLKISWAIFCRQPLEIIKPLLNSLSATSIIRDLDGASVLYVAVQMGHKLLVEDLIGADEKIVSSKHHRHGGLLHVALSQGYSDIAEYLLLKPLPDLNARYNGESLFILAVSSHLTDIAKKIFNDERFKFDYENIDWLVAPIVHQCTETVQFLLDKPIDCNRLKEGDKLKLLCHSLAYPGSHSFLKKMVEINFLNTKNINSPWDLPFGYKSTVNTLLSLAVVNTNVEAVKYLIELGADPNKKEIANQTPLHYAVSLGEDCDEEIIRLLLENGADPYAKDVYGFTPLAIAIAKCKANIIDALLQCICPTKEKLDQETLNAQEYFKRFLDKTGNKKINEETFATLEAYKEVFDKLAFQYI